MLNQPYCLLHIPKAHCDLVEGPKLASCISGAGSGVVVFCKEENLEELNTELEMRAGGAGVMVLDVDG